MRSLKQRVSHSNEVSDADADDEDDCDPLLERLRSSNSSSSSTSARQPRSKNLKKASQRLRIWSGQDIMLLENMIAASVNHKVSPPPPVAGKKWSMVDSGSQPTVADCPKEFPNHKIFESEGQRNGLKYKVVAGDLIPNLGEVHIQHREADGTVSNFTVQNAKVHCPIVSVRELVSKDCSVTF